MSASPVGNSLLDDLPDDELSFLSPHLEPVELKPGACVKGVGEELTHVIFPQSGAISLQVPTSAGHAIEAAVIGSEGAVGAGNATDYAIVEATVQLPGTALRLPKTLLRHPTARGFDLLARLDSFQAFLLAQVQQSVACNAAHAAEARMCRWLLELHDRVDGDVLPLTQEFLSEMLGLQRTTVTLVESKLQSIGAIRCRRGKVHVLDRSLLESHVCECYGKLRHVRGELLDGTAAHARQMTRDRPPVEPETNGIPLARLSPEVRRSAQR